MTNKHWLMTLVLLCGCAAAIAAGTQQQDAEDGSARRAELARLLEGVTVRLASIPSHLECAPQVDLTEHVAMFAEDIARSPLSAAEAERIAAGIVQLDNFVRLYGGGVTTVCQLHDQKQASDSHFAQLRAEVEQRLTLAVTAIQSRMPSSPAELEEIFRSEWRFRRLHGRCYTSSTHSNQRRACLRGGTPFDALRKLVHVADDGVIRPRNAVGLGSDEVTSYYQRHGGGFWSRNHSRLDAENTFQSGGTTFTFGVASKRKALHSSVNMMHWVKSDLRYGLDLLSSATLADIYVGHLVNAARLHAATWCAATVRSGALIANVFNDHAPSAGDAVQPYTDAGRLLRADIEQIAATGTDDLCNGANAQLRSLVGSVVGAAIDKVRPAPPLYTDARTEEELVLRAHARQLRASYLLGDAAVELVATDALQ